jgi:signal transduction histidine kinase/ligand-binding sensor domain-containing protein/CheY-like chemotaxis protein/AraC-like DNA-binding protein
LAVLVSLPWLSLPAQQNLPGDLHFEHEYLVENLTIENGLSDNQINAMIQDRQGFLWIGTDDGLNRYDGYHFTIYKNRPADLTSVSDNNIRALLEDHAGNIWIATANGLNRFNPLTETFTHFQHDPGETGGLSHNDAYALYEDKQGILWVGTRNGLNRFDPKEEVFKWYPRLYTPADGQEIDSEQVHVIKGAQDGRLLVGYWCSGLSLFDKEKEIFQPFSSPPFDQSSICINFIETALDYSRSVINNSLFASPLPTQVEIDLTTVIGDVAVNSARITQSGALLLGTYAEGLFILDKDYRLVQQFKPEKSYVTSPNHNWVRVIYEDQAGAIWLGTGGAGLFHLDLNRNRFANYQSQNDPSNGLPHNFVNALLEVAPHSIWVGTRRHGISIFDQREQKFGPSPFSGPQPSGNLATDEIGVLYQDQSGAIWIGTWGNGLSRFHPGTGTIRHFLHDPDDSTSLSDHFVTSITETKNGELWIGTPAGLSVLMSPEDIINGKFKRYQHIPTDSASLSHPYVRDILQTRSGEIWIGTIGGGLNRFHPKTESFTAFKHVPGDRNAISSNSITTLFEDSKGRLWIGTRGGGLNYFDRAKEIFVNYSEKDGLPDGMIAAIEEDDNAYIWLTTKKGISKFDPERETFKNYSAKDGLFNDSFSGNAFTKGRLNGLFYAGGKHGLSVFHPDSMRENVFVPPIVISSLKKYNYRKGKTNEINVKGISHLTEIELSYRDNIITFEFAALNFHNAQKNQYAYQLTGFNDDWIQLGSRREVTFTNLDPGTYTLRVRGSNNDGRWNEKGTTLKITIIPPWWATNWAYALYILIFLGLLYSLNRFFLRRQELQYQLQTEKEEALRLKELDTFKSRLYTNLTHEFRTPLTVILGMVEEMKASPSKYGKEGLQLVERNGKNLLRLINQLLDLSKLENEAFELNQQQSDIIPFLRYLTESFQSFANQKNLAVHFQTTLPKLVMDYDPAQIHQILTNLISNALKFTPSGGEINLHADRKEDRLHLSVRDTGIGIAAEDLPRIFDRFYQADSAAGRKDESGRMSLRSEGGTGIGLAHTRELIKLMKGEILVESQLGEGTVFQIKLPISRTAPVAAGDIPYVEDHLPTGSWATNNLPDAGALNSGSYSPSEMPTLLIIEDNPDVVTYLKACLQDTYSLEIAYNGRIGIEKALELIPDLIVSDVMMPEKDGYEVCDALKNDERTSHIPIVLLTARADAASRLAGLKRGADAYLAKPFDREELLVRLEKLLELRRQMIERFSKAEFSNVAPPVASTEEEKSLQTEDAFMQKINTILDKNISDEDFGLPQLCQKIRMSRSQLFRKMKALTGDAPSNYIRAYRLHRAKMLLETTGMNVSEVAWAVGYKDVPHFSRSFQEFFNTHPSATRK